MASSAATPGGEGGSSSTHLGTVGCPAARSASTSAARFCSAGLSASTLSAKRALPAVYSWAAGGAGSSGGEEDMHPGAPPPNTRSLAHQGTAPPRRESSRRCARGCGQGCQTRERWRRPARTPRPPPARRQCQGCDPRRLPGPPPCTRTSSSARRCLPCDPSGGACMCGAHVMWVRRVGGSAAGASRGAHVFKMCVSFHPRSSSACTIGATSGVSTTCAPAERGGQRGVRDATRRAPPPHAPRTAVAPDPGSCSTQA